jgi:NAD(P)-dependent dehydrogenase (short-subunit alcohol dehydrogenase family)
MELSLASKRILITGASSGLGAHFARVAVRAGATTVVAARRRDRLAALVSELGPEKASAIELDVTDEQSIERCLAEAGPLDVVINNAGVAETKAATAISGADFDHVVDTNLRGCFLVATAAARRWVDEKRPGTIVNIASILGLRVANSVSTYAISKAGVVQMTKTLALEWARHGIRVNALAPGYLATEINAEFFASEAGAVMTRRIPMRRLGQLSELDAPFLLLASDASSFMTGSVLAVDGGHLVSSL